MVIPGILFWVLMYLGREELGWKGIAISISIWLCIVLDSRIQDYHQSVLLLYKLCLTLYYSSLYMAVTSTSQDDRLILRLQRTVRCSK